MSQIPSSEIQFITRKSESLENYATIFPRT